MVDDHFNRIKIKNPQYVSLAHLSTKDNKGLNELFMLKIVCKNENEEFLSYFPQWKTLYERVKNKLETFYDAFESIYPQYKDLDDENFEKKCEESLNKKGNIAPLIPYLKSFHLATKTHPTLDAPSFFSKIDSEEFLGLIRKTSKLRQKFSKRYIEDSESESPKLTNSKPEQTIGMVSKKKKKNRKKKKTNLVLEENEESDQQIEKQDLPLKKNAKNEEKEMPLKQPTKKEKVEFPPLKKNPPKKTVPPPTKKPKKKNKTDDDLDNLLAHFKNIDQKSNSNSKKKKNNKK